MCYDKALVRTLADASGLPVSAEAFVGAQDDVPAFEYPAFVKPNCGDGSVGITEAAIVNDTAAAHARIAELRAELPGTALLSQEF